MNSQRNLSNKTTKHSNSRKPTARKIKLRNTSKNEKQKDQTKLIKIEQSTKLHIINPSQTDIRIHRSNCSLNSTSQI